MIDQNKIVFITLDWMKEYKGITKDDVPLGTGGSFPKEKKHEVFNFLDDNGICYGYTPPYGKINLDKICKNEIRKTKDGNEYLENVLVIFNASKGDGLKRRIIGFYVDATVFKEPHQNTNPKRIISSSNTFASYNIRANSENVYLFENDSDRNITLPYSKKDGFGYGQSNVWYANNDSRSIVYRNDIINQIENIINKNTIDEFYNDERKYTEGGINSRVKEVFNIRRNAQARKMCLEHYFPNNKNYKCIICGFDFEEQYGELGKNYIEVHHIVSHTIKSKIEGEHEIDPIKDLIPICSNCHSIFHREKPPILVDKMFKIVKTKI